MTEKEMYLREISYEDYRWMQLAQGRAQRRTLALVVMNLTVLLPQCQFEPLH